MKLSYKIIGMLVIAAGLTGMWIGSSFVQHKWDSEKQAQNDAYRVLVADRDKALQLSLDLRHEADSAYIRGKQDAERISEELERSIMSGSLRLSHIAAGLSSSGNAQAECGSHAATTCELSKEDSRRLLRIGRDADATAELLALCQKELVIQWEFCTGKKYAP